MVTEALNRRVVRVPEVTGRTCDKARILLEDAGLKQIVTLYRESYEDRDTVLEQRPARGQMVYETTEVTIWVARRGYLEHLPAIYRRSDAVGRNLVRDCAGVRAHVRLRGGT
jgi:beta-lactam-binding protein with PASTA domain